MICGSSEFLTKPYIKQHQHINELCISYILSYTLNSKEEAQLKRKNMSADCLAGKWASEVIERVSRLWNLSIFLIVSEDVEHFFLLILLTWPLQPLQEIVAITGLREHISRRVRFSGAMECQAPPKYSTISISSSSLSMAAIQAALPIRSPGYLRISSLLSLRERRGAMEFAWKWIEEENMQRKGEDIISVCIADDFQKFQASLSFLYRLNANLISMHAFSVARQS